MDKKDFSKRKAEKEKRERTNKKESLTTLVEKRG